MQKLERDRDYSRDIGQINFPKTHTLTQRLTSEIWKKHAGQMGQKTTNLMKLKEIAQYLKETKQFHLNIVVPEFQGISDSEMKAFLQQQGVPLHDLWEQFKQAQGSERAFLTQEADKALQHLQQAIEQAFDQADFASSEMESWINNQASQRLMVRSTGKEDTAEVSNPGGNESVSAVKPDAHSVSQAMKTVITSYLHPKSLEQRMLLGDDIFSEPFLPVLLQEMVGEPPGGAKTTEGQVTSGVLFARESEGKTPQTTHIQCAPGHAELIANGLGGFDTFHCHQEDIYSVIGVKDIRKVAAEEGPELIAVTNNRDVKNAPSLSTASLRDLHLLAQTVREVWGTDVDIEFSVSHDAIHLYQVRPASKTKEIIPSYVSDPAQFPAFAGVTIGAAGGAVRQIKAADEVIIADKLKEALNRFLALKDKSKVKAVLVKHWQPTNSHEAQFFRSVHIPTLAIEDQQGLQECVKKRPIHLWVDPQQGLVVNAEAPEVKEGWISHPIPALLSLLTWEGQKDLGPFWLQLAEAYRQLPSDQREIHSLNDLRANFETVKFGQADEVLRALSKIVFYVQRKASRDETDSKELVRIFQNVLGHSEAAYRVASQSESPVLSRLYAANFLEASLFQKSSQEFVSNDSLLSALSSIKQEAKLQARLEARMTAEAKGNPFLLQLAKVGSLALSEEQRTQWEEFVLQLITHHPEGIQNLAQIIVHMQKYNQLALWMNVSFSSVWKASDYKADVCVDVLLRQFLRNQKAFNWMDKAQQASLTAQRQMDKWEKPENFDKQFARFQKDFVKSLDFKDAKVIFDTSSRLGKLAMIQSLRAAIDVFDQSIKTMKNSPYYENDRKLQVERFTAMLQPYMQLLEDVYQTMTSDMKKQLDPYYEETSLRRNPDNVMEKIREILDAKLSQSAREVELEASRNFSVAAARFCSGAAFDRHEPKTCEDLFTLIHQDLNSLLSVLGAEYGIPVEQLPAEVKQTAQQVASLELPDIDVDATNISITRVAHPNLLGVDLAYPHVLVSFGLPLRNHSAQIQLKSSPDTQKIELTFSMFGPNRFNRMDFACIVAQLGSQLSGFAFKDGYQPTYDPYNMNMELTWELPAADMNPQMWQELKTYIRFMIALTVPEWGRVAFQKEGFDWPEYVVDKWDVRTVLANFKKQDERLQEKPLDAMISTATPLQFFAFTTQLALCLKDTGVPVDYLLDTIYEAVAREEIPVINSQNLAHNLLTEQNCMQDLIKDLLQKLQGKHPRSEELEKAFIDLLEWRCFPFFALPDRQFFSCYQYLLDTGRPELIDRYFEKYLALMYWPPQLNKAETFLRTMNYQRLNRFLSSPEGMDKPVMQKLASKMRDYLFQAELVKINANLFFYFFDSYLSSPSPEERERGLRELVRVADNKELALATGTSFIAKLIPPILERFPDDQAKIETFKELILEGLKGSHNKYQSIQNYERDLGMYWPLFKPAILEYARSESRDLVTFLHTITK